MTEFKILGQRRGYSERFDPNLAKRIEAWDREMTLKEEAERLRKEWEARLRPKAKPAENQKPTLITLDDSTGILDEESALGGATKTQGRWIEHWNGANGGRYFASMRDMYDAFKQIKQDPAGHKELLANLRKDFKGQGVVTSTRIFYNANDLGARIVHHCGSSNGSLKREFTLDVPIYKGVGISEALGNQSGIDYLRAFFGTEDNPDDMIETLEYVGGKNKKDISLWTPEQDGKKSFPKRAAWLFYGNYGFRLGGDDIYGYGRSFGVRYASDSGR